MKRKDTGLFTRTAVLLCAIFLVCLLLTPITGSRLGRPITARNDGSNLARTDTSMEHAGKTYFITEFSGNELWDEIELTLTSNRNIQSVQKVLLRIFYYIIPIIGLGVLIYYIGYVLKKRKRIKSIMSISIGGHAPPMI